MNLKEISGPLLNSATSLAQNHRSLIFRSWINISITLMGAVSVATMALVAVSWYLTTDLGRFQRYIDASLSLEQALDEYDEFMVGEETPLKMQQLRDPVEKLIIAIKNRAQQRAELGIPPMTHDINADNLYGVANWQLSTATGQNELNETAIEEGVLALRRGLKEDLLFRRNLLKNTQTRSSWLFGVSTAFAFILAMVVVALAWLMDNRILRPLKSLSEFLHRIERREYASFSDNAMDPLLKPLVTQYNSMVSALTEHEAASRHRQNVLAAEVRNASRALLEQQIALFRAQQQAESGELSASIAHEIRNPLAGMSMALASLKDDLKDQELAQRVDLVVNELNRVKRLLNNFLDGTRIRPEKISRIHLRSCVESLLQLARYQIPDTITFRIEIPEDLQVHLPEAGLRQAILNLLLNAAQAIGNTPGEIIVGARCEDKELSIYVYDSGPGFPEDILRNGIRPYDSRRGGTGLGLPTVRRFSQNYDGRVILSKQTNGGGAVTIIFPKDKCSPHE